MASWTWRLVRLKNFRRPKLMKLQLLSHDFPPMLIQHFFRRSMQQTWCQTLHSLKTRPRVSWEKSWSPWPDIGLYSFQHHQHSIDQTTITKKAIVSKGRRQATKIGNETLFTYPHKVPRMRFIMKKAPTKTRDTKYSHGHVLPTASFTYVFRKKTKKGMVQHNTQQNKMEKSHT